MIRGQRITLADVTPAKTIQVGVMYSYGGTGDVDISCFGVQASGKLSDDRYLIFYNQLESPEGAICMYASPRGDIKEFRLDLNALPAHVQRMVFVATIDGPGAMNQLCYGHIRLLEGEKELCMFRFTGADFTTEKAVMMAELYQRDGTWRFGTAGQGFASGLRGVLKHFGGEEMITAEPQPQYVIVTERQARQMGLNAVQNEASDNDENDIAATPQTRVLQ